jgi:two-component sensor histidine kinase
VKKKINKLPKDEIHEKNTLQVIQSIVDTKTNKTDPHTSSFKEIS